MGTRRESGTNVVCVLTLALLEKQNPKRFVSFVSNGYHNSSECLNLMCRNSKILPGDRDMEWSQLSFDGGADGDQDAEGKAIIATLMTRSSVAEAWKLYRF